MGTLDLLVHRRQDETGSWVFALTDLRETQPDFFPPQVWKLVPTKLHPAPQFGTWRTDPPTPVIYLDGDFAHVCNSYLTDHRAIPWLALSDGTLLANQIIARHERNRVGNQPAPTALWFLRNRAGLTSQWMVATFNPLADLRSSAYFASGQWELVGVLGSAYVPLDSAYSVSVLISIPLSAYMTHRALRWMRFERAELFDNGFLVNALGGGST